MELNEEESWGGHEYMDDVGDDVGDDDDDEEEKFIRTFHIGDNDAEIDDKLIHDRAVTLRPVHPRQASYHKPDDWRQRNRIGLEEVKEQLEYCIDSMLHETSSFNLQLTHNDNEPIMENEEPIVWHEPILDEYWNQLERIGRSHKIYPVTKIERVEIVNVEVRVNCFISFNLV
jgi:hypothetical protein